MNIIDLSTPLSTNKISCLKAQGVECIIRYYTRNLNSTKLLRQDEAKRIVSSGLHIAVVYQDTNNELQHFSKSLGIKAGNAAYAYARNAIGQPEDSAIYFSVDHNFDAADIASHIAPYFEGVNEAFVAAGGGQAEYRIGVYGSGLTCKSLLDANLVSLTWLAGAMGWRDSKKFFESNKWNLRQFASEEILCGVKVDRDIANTDNPDFGQFTIYVEPSSDMASISQRYMVTARSGLRLRGGPGTEYEILKLLPAGTVVFVQRESNGWMEVDLEGDGLVDGWASGAFLRAVAM